MNRATSPRRWSAEFRLSPGGRLGRVGEHQGEGTRARPGIGLVVQRLGAGKKGKQVDDVVRGVDFHRHLVRGHGRVYGVAKELLETRHRNDSGFSSSGRHDQGLYRVLPRGNVRSITDPRQNQLARPAPGCQVSSVTRHSLTS